MKNKIKATIDAAVDVAQSISKNVGNVVDTVIDEVENMSETVEEIKECATNVVEIVKESPSVEDVMKAMFKDSRVGHFLVDVLTGVDVKEASVRYFEDSSGVQESQLNKLINEAEERGYLRGRNEAIEVKMQEPAEWQSPEDLQAKTHSSNTTILNKVRRSVWE